MKCIEQMNTMSTKVSKCFLMNRIVQWHLEKAIAESISFTGCTPSLTSRTGEETATNSKQRSRWQDINTISGFPDVNRLIEQYEEFLTWKI